MSILDPNWKYVKSNETDIRKTFAKERKRLKEIADRQKADDAEALAKLCPIRKVKVGAS